MKIGLIGPSYQERSLPFDAQRTINLYPVIDESQEGKEVAALYGTPGLSIFCTAGIGTIRGVFASTNGRAFCVSGTQFFEISSAGVATLRGTLTSDDSTITFAENPTQLAICDGEKIYIFTYASNAFTTPTLAASPAYTVTQLDGYFIYNTDQGQFYWSGLYDGSTWSALDFATAEGSPDGLTRVFVSGGQLVLLGDTTTEIWLVTGNGGADAFERIEGGRIDVGCVAAHSVVNMDNTIFWLGKTRDGQGVVYKANGYTPERISTHAIEYQINKSSDLENIRAYTYMQDGHLFYVLTGGNLETTFVYDAATQLWHERAYLEEDGTYSTHKSSSCMFVFGKHLVGDRSNGNIYHMSLDYFDDNGREIKATRVFSHLNKEGQIFRINELQVDFEYGVGLTGGTNPLVWLRISVDGGHTFGPELQASIGKIGNYKTRAAWRRLGITNNEFTFEVSISDPVKRAICGAYAK